MAFLVREGSSNDGGSMWIKIQTNKEKEWMSNVKTDNLENNKIENDIYARNSGRSCRDALATEI